MILERYHLHEQTKLSKKAASQNIHAGRPGDVDKSEKLNGKSLSTLRRRAKRLHRQKEAGNGWAC